MPRVSWKIAGPLPPMPHRSLVDGTTVTDLTRLPLPYSGLEPNGIHVPLDAASRPRFLRHARRTRDVPWSIPICCGTLALWLIWQRHLAVHDTYGLPTALLLGPPLWLVILHRLGPPQYPYVRGSHLVFSNVHAATADEWQRLAGITCCLR
ncbi:hypothetical protein [Dactylosporangium sp. NPDC051541]|uniref:hypothetical protein n=1 Tax=Dactylosporangium sp. NPDC051541 TaxID=3363977 RepID=UPI00378A93C2